MILTGVRASGKVLFFTGAVAQLGERMTGSHEVDGSIPFSSTKKIKGLAQIGLTLFHYSLGVRREGGL